MKYAVIDFETANSSFSSACSVGIVLVDELEIVSKHYFLINPNQHFNQRNIQIHNITKEDVMDAPSIFELKEVFDYLFQDRIIVAHNAAFDMNVLIKSLTEYQRFDYHYNYLCTVTLSRKAYTNLDNHKLNTVSNYLNIDLNHHHALDDALACAKILIDILEKGQVDVNSYIKTKSNIIFE